MITDNYTKEQVEEIVKRSKTMKEVILALGYRSCNGSNNITVKRYLDKNNISYSHFIGTTNSTKRSVENVFCKNSTATQAVLRRWYIKGNYSEYKCSICGIEPIWNGKPLSLTLDHINGDNRDHRLENLRWVCPNCDRQLPTYGFKRGAQCVGTESLYFKEKANRKDAKEKGNSDDIKPAKFCTDCGAPISPAATRCIDCHHTYIRRKWPDIDTLKNDLREMNFVEVGRKYGVSERSVRKWCEAYGLSTKIKKHR